MSTGVQAAPFQVWDCSRPYPFTSTELPTAMHEPAGRHDTSVRTLPFGPSGSGVMSIVHDPPARRSAKVCARAPLGLLASSGRVEPTVVQFPPAVQLTPRRAV